jgi:hypothetical protein
MPAHVSSGILSDEISNLSPGTAYKAYCLVCPANVDLATAAPNCPPVKTLGFTTLVGGTASPLAIVSLAAENLMDTSVILKADVTSSPADIWFVILTANLMAPSIYDIANNMVPTYAYVELVRGRRGNIVFTQTTLSTH